MIDAVEALLAGKLDEEDIRHGATGTRIEGVFALSRSRSTARLRELLAERGIESDEDTLVIHCELRREGRSVFRVNGHAVTRAFLQELGRSLVDVHGQSEHLSLLDRRYQLDFLDSYAHALDLRQSFAIKAAELHKAKQALETLVKEEKESAHRREFLRFQLDEIGHTSLREGEEEELEAAAIAKEALEEAARFSNTIENLLTLSRFEESRRALDIRRTDLVRIIDDALDAMRPAAAPNASRPPSVSVSGAT